MNNGLVSSYDRQTDLLSPISSSRRWYALRNELIKNCGLNRMCKEKKVIRDKKRGSEVLVRKDILWL